MDSVKMRAASERGLVIEFGQEINPAVNARVHGLAKKLVNEYPEVIQEVVPTYRSLLVYFDPLQISRAALTVKVEQCLRETAEAAVVHEAERIYIPVCYDEEFGPDLSFVASHNGLSEADVVKIHTSKPYLVYMLGFTPGFPYLGGMDERIATPRLTKPRTRIPAGSVGIAGSQTGFYPLETPGGWQLIGRTPVKAFDPAAKTPFLLEAGVYLQFQAISRAEYEELAETVAAGRYEVRRDRVSLGGASRA